MSIRSNPSKMEQGDDEDETSEESQIKWSDLIFLPFHPVFKIFVLISVICKSMLGPIQAVYSIVHCTNVMDENDYLVYLKYFYSYFVDLIYAVDTFFHVVHRQVTDKAMTRQHLPKSAFLLLVDVFSLIPFYTMVATEMCPEVQLWPNILAFSEFIVIYRVFQYFDLALTHSYRRLFFGFTILFLICVNCVGCFLILLTIHGLCDRCNGDITYDWRKHIARKLNETDIRYTTYIYATSFMMSLSISDQFDETKPSTILEYVLISTYMIIAYLLYLYIVVPKLFAECILNLRRICTFFPHVRRLIEETKRRNPSPNAYKNVANFYDLMWKKRSGITNIPEMITELPRYLRIDIRQDLVWPLFYHSPTLRKTSSPFKRWLCDYIYMDYKLPGEKFFVGPHCHSNIYYLKSGIVELISADDGVTPLLSLTGGTLFGDVSFIVPPLKRNLIVRSVTYCEVHILSRFDIFKAMQKYPVDRKNIVNSVKERLKHARTLYACKQHIRGLDRVEDEGLAWLKRRWWEISETVANWRKRPKSFKLEMPPEEAVYHCAKYLGQLVLCTDLQLNKTSLFANVKFPWILTPHTVFINVWKRIVMFTVFLVLIIYPPNITSKQVYSWFFIVRIWTDIVYIADIGISLMTSSDRKFVADSFAAVMFDHCKTSKFVLNVLSTVWIELLAWVAGQTKYYYILQFNRLIKVYILFSNEYITEWNAKREPIINVCYKVVLKNFCFLYITGYGMYFLATHFPIITTSFFFGTANCVNDTRILCGNEEHFAGVIISFMYELLFFEYVPNYLNDVYFACSIAFIGFLISTYTKCKLIAYLYLKHREVINYQVFVSTLQKYYKHHKIHSDLLKRLNRYLICQWKYYQGADIMQPNMLKQEPFDIYWKVHGEVAEKIIGESKAFTGADPLMVRELAYAAKFFTMPKNATLFLFGVQCRNVTWIARGHVKCEYHNESGELLESYHDPGEMVSVSAVLMKKPSLRTYSTCTECELIFIKIQDFFNVIRRYPHEMSYFQNCIEDYGPVFQTMFESYVKTHRDYQKKRRENLMHGEPSMLKKQEKEEEEAANVLVPPGHFYPRIHPDSDFIYYWMWFRMLTVLVSISCASFQGGSGAIYRRVLWHISVSCDVVAWTDIILKSFTCYYDERGILITNRCMCFSHYLCRGFLLDIVGAIPWYELINDIMEEQINEYQALLFNTFCKFAHIYIVIAFFDYIADAPSANSVYVLIIKWQVIMTLVMMVGSHYLMNHCLEFTFDKNRNLVDLKKRNECWIPSYMNIPDRPTIDHLNLIYAQSFNLAQGSLVRINLGKFHINRNDLGVGLAMVIMGIIFWYVMCYSLTLLVVSSRYNTVFQHGVSQLQKFLKAERVDKPLINEAMAHFGYWWIRNKGISRHRLMDERIGVVFRQDLSYYFFKKTFVALDTLLHGGEQMQRQLSSIGHPCYMRPGQEVMREMDLMSEVFVVHRGKVIISKGGVKLAELTKGSMFGQLVGTKARPVRCSAVAEGYADVLHISVEQFQETITDEVRRYIARNKQSKDDYMAVKKKVIETPYNTVAYILRGRKTIMLPWMKEPIEARSHTWYSKWLYVAWLIGPSLSTFVVLMFSYLPMFIRNSLPLYALFTSDIIHLAHFMSEFYTVELTVVGEELVHRRLGYRVLKCWGFYVDLITLIVPFATCITHCWRYQLVRVFRIRLFYDFHRHFCLSFKSRITPLLMKVIIVFLLMHAVTCGWIFVACRDDTNIFPVVNPVIPYPYNTTIDSVEWVHPDQREDGCPRLSRDHWVNGIKMNSFLVPKDWYNDYIVAMMYTIMLLAHNSIDVVVVLTLKEVIYKLFVNWFIILLDMWLLSVAISTVYTNFRERYQYDYSVNNLTTYLHHSGLSPVLLRSVRNYTRQLWQRQRGNWLPELALQAPVCLQEDLMCALYLHHLKTPVLFKNLPLYFTRQVVARFQRAVIFPGKCIVLEGDIFPCIYFIHEGEVEKWYTDVSGEKKLFSLLSTNGFFGLVPGLFPNVPFTFSYYTRTVVDLVYLRLNAWQDLLSAYPNIRNELYKYAKELKQELAKTKRIKATIEKFF